MIRDEVAVLRRQFDRPVLQPADVPCSLRWHGCSPAIRLGSFFV